MQTQMSMVAEAFSVLVFSMIEIKYQCSQMRKNVRLSEIVLSQKSQNYRPYISKPYNVSLLPTEYFEFPTKKHFIPASERSSHIYSVTS